MRSSVPIRKRDDEQADEERGRGHERPRALPCGRAGPRGDARAPASTLRRRGDALATDPPRAAGEGP